MWCEGVVGGNEAIQTLLADELISNDGTPTKSLGIDILRLALERGTSAKHAVDICIHFLETYGQGGPCSTDDQDWTYENSFLFADSNEAYVLETAGSRHWAYEHIKKGEYRNISNGISIRSNCIVSKDIQSICKQNGWWDGTSVFDWKKSVGTGGSVDGLESCGGREASGLKHLKAIKAEADKMQSPPTPRYWVDAMANNILRDESSGICFRDRHGFCSTGSQISWLVPSKSKEEDYHFFTGASDPLFGTPYKLFQFSNQVKEQQTDHDTTVLWNTWRKRALVRKEMNSAQRDALLSIEEEAFSYLEHDKEKNVNHHSTFSEVVQREIIELLKDS